MGSIDEPKGATMDNFMNMTKKAGHTGELQRLVDLHAVYNDAMDGQLILTPINLEEPGKRILDSGTADDLRNSFNRVHVRGSLAGSSPKRPVDVIKNLASPPKPGGWIQLMEMNAFNPPSNGPAMTGFARMASEVWTGIGVGDFANQLKSMLEEAGLQNGQEKRIIVELGKRAKPELRAQSVNGVSAPVAPIASVAKSVSTSFDMEQLDGLQRRVRTELESEGGRSR
ncbi:MAG: hypothetical protein Q9166_006118 [cf. Caloplaca sp. 2 TL-2023]